MIPTSVKEVKALGWDYIDVIIFSGDAFVDHPSFGTAVIARWLQKYGYRVAGVPQPNCRDDRRDFRQLGAPRLYFGVNAGAMDSMVNHYTASKRLRSDDAYTPDGRAGQRPDYAVTVYTRILKEMWPEIPVVIGGIEASLRRVTHYDYWQDSLMPSILVSSGADWLCYGMGEKPMLELTRAIEHGRNISEIRRIPQIAFRMDGKCRVKEAVFLNSFERCSKDKAAFAENFHIIETYANMMYPPVIVEPVGNGYVQINPTYPPATQEEMDSFWDLPFTKQPHPRYKGKRIPAYDMIKFSVNTHRGCFGGCNFCTIAAHQGKFIQSRSEESIIREISALNALPGFAGNISDVGAPTANMYGMRGKDAGLCAKCRRKSCLFPSPCRNMDRSHARLLKLYSRIAAVKGIRHAYIGSGIRYDRFLAENVYVEDPSYPY
ncbi:MAG: YgiQ family radical SAM protein, partial [Bacteroidales bacterium]|nr:YgiQ family radical SAM protein [Bacteroidales bacterium]